MATDGLSSKRLARLRERHGRHVDSGFVPGAMTLVEDRTLHLDDPVDDLPSRSWRT